MTLQEAEKLAEIVESIFDPGHIADVIDQLNKEFSSFKWEHVDAVKVRVREKK